MRRSRRMKGHLLIVGLGGNMGKNQSKDLPIPGNPLGTGKLLLRQNRLLFFQMQNHIRIGCHPQTAGGAFHLNVIIQLCHRKNIDRGLKRLHLFLQFLEVGFRNNLKFLSFSICMYLTCPKEHPSYMSLQSLPLFINNIYMMLIFSWHLFIILLQGILQMQHIKELFSQKTGGKM